MNINQTSVELPRQRVIFLSRRLYKAQGTENLGYNTYKNNKLLLTEKFEKRNGIIIVFCIFLTILLIILTICILSQNKVPSSFNCTKMLRCAVVNLFKNIFYFFQLIIQYLPSIATQLQSSLCGLVHSFSKNSVKLFRDY